MPRLPMSVPRAASAMMSPVGVPRLYSGMGGRYAVTSTLADTTRQRKLPLAASGI
jgi:hypothetical protein